jgi:hypothetical protein
MRAFLLALASLAVPYSVDAQSGPGTGISGSGINTSPTVISIAAFGAVCNETTNDTTAINAAIAAAAHTNAYVSGGLVVVTGPSNGQRCSVTQINATGLTKGQIRFENLTLLCSGAGNICFDDIGSTGHTSGNLVIIGGAGLSTVPPAIGFQNGNLNIGTATCCIGSHVNLQVSGTFTFAPFYSLAAESESYYGSIFTNSYSATGPIWTLGSVTGGSGYSVPGTYTAVPLTGGTCTDPPLATVVVSGGAVTTVTVTYQGKGCTAADVLSAANANLGGAGSGFSVPVSTTTGYACVLDGQNHWNATSAYATVLSARDVYATFSEANFFGGSCRYTGTGNVGSAMWMGGTVDHSFYRTYFNTSAAAPIIQLFDNGVASNAAPYFDISAEGGSATYTWWLYGANASPVLENARFRAMASQGSIAVLGTDTNITHPAIPGTTIELPFPNAQVFSKAAPWKVAGNVYVHALRDWNQPDYFRGNISGIDATGTHYVNNLYGPLDIYGSAAGAWSCSRLLLSTYTGPLCNVERTSDSTNVDIYPDGFGNLDKAAYQSFCANTTCKVNEAYDQSGNANNANQSTVASQPVLTLVDSNLGNRPSMAFVGAGAVALVVTQAATINNVWAAGGYATMVVNQTAPVNPDRLIYKSNGSSLGWDFRQSAVTSVQLELVQDASTSNALFTDATSETNAPHVIDIQYNNSASTNVPIISVDGTARTLGTSTAYVGTAGTDAAQNLIIGNNAATGGTRSYKGNIPEIIIWATEPSALQLEAVRRNEAAYYGVPSVN